MRACRVWIRFSRSLPAESSYYYSYNPGGLHLLQRHEYDK